LASTDTHTEQDHLNAAADQHDHEGHEHSHEPAMNEACRREISVEVPADIFAGEIDKMVQKYQKLARIPGFRKGKVPSTLIRRQFMGEIRSEVLDTIVPRYFSDEVRKQGLVPISQPRVTDLSMDEGQPLKFTAAFEVMPEIKVSGYKELKSEAKEVTVSDEEVEAELKRIQDSQSTFENVDDRELRDGDFAAVSFTGHALGSAAVVEKKQELAGEGETPAVPEQKPIDVKDVLVEIGGEKTVKDFTDNLRGAKPGETRSFDVRYADDFSDERLAGQVFHYNVNIEGVKKKTVPALDDEFAKSLGGQFDSIDAVRKGIRESLEAQRKHEVEHTAKEKLVDDLVAGNDFPVPEALVNQQIDTRLDRGLRALAAQGMKTEDMRKLNFGRLREAQRDAALREVKPSLLLDKIADLEKLDASDEDIEKELQQLAGQMHQPIDSLRQRLSKEGTIDRIKDRIRNEKALDFIYRQSA
jgi:trigger factor